MSSKRPKALQKNLSPEKNEQARSSTETRCTFTKIV